jgi:membrane associated rhomboid family serine protease
MLIPYSTDAPIYHWPFATLGTIILNSLIYLGVAMLPEEQRDAVYRNFILLYGHWNPIQWVTSNYMHAGFMHVFGNMIVLWGIGIIVEGKVGWWVFLLIYNLIGIAQNCIEQTLMLSADHGGSLGASSIIFGLIMISLLWAPKNELQCVLLFGYIPRQLEISVMSYALFSVGVQVVMAAVIFTVMSAKGTFIAMTSQVLHLMGAACGLAVGVVMLKRGWVDCENWDLFSVMQNRHTMSREQLAQEALNSEEGKARKHAHRNTMQAEFLKHLSSGEAAAALAVHRRGGIQFGKDWQVGEKEHVQLISGLRKAEKWDDSVQTMVEYLQTYAERAPLIRLALAQMLVEHMSRPGQALKVLSKLDPQTLAPHQQAVLARVRERAKKEAAEDPFEISAEDW